MIALGVLLGLFVGEVAARAFGFRYRPHMRNRVYFAEPDPDRGWRNRAGIAGPYGGDEFVTWVTLNDAGQRGTLHSRERTPGKRRIAILGDSQAWGDGVSDAETFAALLENAETEVVNLAVLGYGTDQQLLTFEEEGAAYQPDVVVVVVYLGNDLRDNTFAGTGQFPKPWFDLEGGEQLVLRGTPVEHSTLLQAFVELYRAAMRSSAILNALAEANADTNTTKPGGRDGWYRQGRPMRTVYGQNPTEQDLYALRLTGRLLVEIGRRARAHGATPVVLILPEHWQVEASNDAEWRNELRTLGIDWRRPQRVLRRALEAEGIPVIDATQALARASRGHAGPERTFYPRWKHLTVTGHRVLADLLRPRVAASSFPEQSGQDR